MPNKTPTEGPTLINPENNNSNPGVRRCTWKEVEAAAVGHWPAIYAQLAPLFRDAIELDGGSGHVDCPVHKGEHGDAFRMFDDWRQNGGCVCNTCGKFPTGLAALNWVNSWATDYTIAQIAAVLGIDKTAKRGRGRPPKPKTIDFPPKPSTNGHAGPSKSPANHAQTLEISKLRAKITARWQSAIPDKGRIADYLTHRGLDLANANLNGVPPSLKLIESLEYFDADPANPKQQILAGHYPAMAAMVHHPSLGIVAMHRTYLSATEGDHGKAPVKAAKKLSTPIYQGATSGAAIRLYPATGETLALAEGIETALAIRQATGTPTWSTVSAGGLGSIELPGEIRTVEIWADAGDIGSQKAKQAAERLAAEGRRVYVISPPSPESNTNIDTDAKPKDWLDILISDGVEALTTAKEAAQEFRRATGEIVDIYLRADEHEVTDEVVSAIANDPIVYCRGGQLVHVITDGSRSRPGILRPSIAPRIALMPEPTLRERITACCRLLTKNDKGEDVHAHPPNWLVRETASRGRWPAVRHLESIVEAPIIRHDGSVFAAPGYDFASGVLYEPDQSSVGDGSSIPPIPINPTKTEIQAAVVALLEVVRDFPFATPAHQSAWLAAVLTPFARFAFRGPAPLFLIDANVRGAGKSLLCDLVGLIVSGREMARMVNTKADDEMRKRITAIAIAGDPLVLIDNVSDSLGSPGLDAALTSSTWSDRILGKSENTVPMPLCATWYATGNNVVLKSDLARRVCHIRLESPEENPEERTAFAHNNIRGYVFKNRPQLIAAALTILRGYTAVIDGKPENRVSLASWGSFEGWSDLVRGAIVYAGSADPGETRLQVREESDSEGQSLRSFMWAWEKLDENNSGMTISEAIKRIDEFSEHGFNDVNLIRNAFIEFAFSKDGKSISARSVGMKLHHFKGRYIAGKCFTRKTSDQNSIVWTISSFEGTTGTKGTKSLTPCFQGNNSNNSTDSTVNGILHTSDVFNSPQTYIGQNSPLTPRSPLFVEEII